MNNINFIYFFSLYFVVLRAFISVVTLFILSFFHFLFFHYHVFLCLLQLYFFTLFSICPLLQLEKKTVYLMKKNCKRIFLCGSACVRVCNRWAFNSYVAPMNLTCLWNHMIQRMNLRRTNKLLFVSTQW